jgi:hypothetical protein
MLLGGDPMRLDTISTDRLALCPSCGKSMRFARSFHQGDGFSELNTFECRQCGVALTAEAALDDSEMAAP